VKQGSYEDGVDGTSPDKLTLFGTHPIGEGSRRGWYGSALQEASLVDGRASDKTFRTATATWYQDHGKTTNDYTKDLSPNSAFFSGGTADDMTTWVVGNPDARPNGDYKYASEEIASGGITQPVWEPGLNQGASSGSDFYGAVGYNFEYTFAQAITSGIGPFSLDVGESMTILWACAGGFRAQGMLDALDAAEWAWDKGWDISSELPTPPAPDVDVLSTAVGTVLVSWTDVSSIDADVDGYKIWRADQSKRTNRLQSGFRALNSYQHLHEVGGETTPYLDDVNPWFDAESEFTETENQYEPAEWGTYDLIAKIPNSELSGFTSNTPQDFDYSWEDPDAATGLTYWYYVSSYREGSYTGPFGPIGANHVESSNFNRNGRNSPNASPGEIGLVTPWGGTYPFAYKSPDFPPIWSKQYQNLGAPFVAGTRLVSNEAEERPGHFALHPNYPNPFNPATIIRYELPEQALVKIAVYDALGRLVEVLSTKYHAPGTYAVTWEPRNLPSGVYFVRMEAGRYTKTNQMLLLK
jgi:hypothetical protein